MKLRYKIISVGAAGLLVCSFLSQAAISQMRFTARTQTKQPRRAAVVDPSSNQTPSHAEAPSAEQVRDHFFQCMETRLKARANLKSGWQDVYVTRKGAHIYAYVESGRVKETAVGGGNLGVALTRHAPAGLKAAVTGGREAERARTLRKGAPNRGEGGVFGVGGLVAEKPTGPSGPSKEECIRRYFKCMLNNETSLWSRLKVIKAVLTIDLDGVEGYVDEAQANFERCIGSCKKVLGLE